MTRGIQNITKFIGNFGVKNLKLRGNVETYVTKIFEIKDVVSVLFVRMKKDGHSPNHTHKNKTVLIPLKGSGTVTGDVTKRIGKGDVFFIAENQVHGLIDVTSDFCFLSICIGGRIVTDKVGDKDDFTLK